MCENKTKLQTLLVRPMLQNIFDCVLFSVWQNELLYWPLLGKPNENSPGASPKKILQ